jgi:hypothetical protein
MKIRKGELKRIKIAKLGSYYKANIAIVTITN